MKSNSTAGEKQAQSREKPSHPLTATGLGRVIGMARRHQGTSGSTQNCALQTAWADSGPVLAHSEVSMPWVSPSASTSQNHLSACAYSPKEGSVGGDLRVTTSSPK